MTSAQPYVLLLVGSAKSPGASTSEAFGVYLCHQLSSYGWKTHTEYVRTVFESSQNLEALLRTIDEVDLFLLVSPLHHESLPYLVTLAMERIASHRQTLDIETSLPTHFAAVINCGKPEALHNDIAVDICEQFALQAKFEWSGGLGIGGGGRINGKDPSHHGSRSSSIVDALDMAADALAVGSTIPVEAIELVAEPVVPVWLYRRVGNMRWRFTALRHGVYKRMADRPLLE